MIRFYTPDEKGFYLIPNTNTFERDRRNLNCRVQQFGAFFNFCEGVVFEACCCVARMTHCQEDNNSTITLCCMHAGS